MVGSEHVKDMIKKKFPSLSSLGSDGNTSFLRAARAGHLDKVLEHLRNNVDINTSNTNGLNALHLASKDGHINVVTELLKRGASVDSATKKGNTALHIASLAGQEDVVRLLVEHGASVNVQSQNGFTPLYMAAQESHDNVVKYLLANGANQSLATEDGFTPLAVAMQQGHDKVVAVLLENDTRGKVRLPALHIAAKKDDCKAAALLLQNEHNPDVTSKSGFTPLHIASHYGNEGIANLLLNKGADVNYSAKHNITPLHVAAKWGKSNMVSLLLGKGANIESRTRDGLTPLHCAARSGHEQVVDMLLERGAPMSSKTKNGLAPLHMSSQGDHVDAARILLYHRAPVDEVTVDYLTALHVAAHCGHARVAKLLLDRKADPNARALNGFTPLHIACKKNRIKVVELLLKHGASIEATTESGLTPLHVASFMGCMNIVIYLLQNEANPDVPTVRGETPLHLAARANQTDIIRILLRNGAQVDARAREQQTPLHIAARLGNVDIVMLLLQHGAAADCTTKDLYSALHIAAKEGQDEVAAVLLENGASPTATTKKGFTPLHLAAKYGNMKVARLLLQRDAPVDAQGKNGVTPLHVASHYDHQNVALLLLDKGASPHATAKNGHTPLHIAAKKNQMDIATTLLEYGAKASAESKAGFTPLHLSAQEGHTDMSCLLLDHHADTNHKAKNGLTPLHLCAQEDRVNVASVLVKNGAEINTTTKAGYTPLHVACHFGQLAMVKFLLEEGADVAASTAVGYTPLHQAAQQGHCAAVNCLLESGAPPNATTNQGQTAMSIAQKLGYISVVETLKGVTEPTITPTATEEKYKVVSPETMQETFMSDSEDEGGEDTLLSEQPYRYLTVDEMKSLGDDSLPIDVRQDERQDSNREYMTAPPAVVDDTISPQHLKEAYSQFTTPDNIDITRHPLHVGKLQWRNFLVSFLVDARGGAMRGCRHSGVRVIVPPRRASMPVRVTCRYLKRDKLSHPPPLMEGEALASRILELGPVGAKFLGPVMIEVPHFGSLRGKEREIVILRSDNGETWREHTVDCSEEAVQDVLSHSFDKEDLSQLEENSRTTRILTTDFPHYFAVVTRVRQEVHAIGPEGGMVSSSVVPQVQAVFPQGALTKKIKVGLQAQPISAELAAKMLGNRVAVSPIVTVEPRRRKFHKPITLTIPKPQAASKGMINQYSGDAPTLRLLCSITGGTTRAQWEDVTGSTPFTFVNDCVSFTTTVSARFWLMDCRNVGDATKMATELYREAIHVPFMAKFVVFAKRVDPLEARLRIFCMTDDKEDKTLEHQEHFTEVAKSRDVEVLEGKTQYVEFAGNLVPVTKSGEQLQLGFRAFRENRLPFTVRVKDPHADCVGRTLFMREARLPKGEPPQQPICVLNIVLPEEIIPEAILPEHELHKYSFIQDSSGLESYQRVDLRLSDVSNLLGEDWPRLAEQLDVAPSHINRLKSEHPHSVAQQGLAMLRFWLSDAGNKAQASTLETALSRIGRDDIVQQCVFNVDKSELQLLKDDSRDASLRRSIPYSDKDIMKDSESLEDLSRVSPKKAGDEKDDKEERKYEAEEKVVEEANKSVSERRKEIEKRLSLEKPLEKKSDIIITKVPVEKEEDFSEKEIAEEKRVSSPEEEPSELSFEQKRLSFEQGKRVIEMKPESTTMKEVKERADERLLAEERRLAEAQENKSLIDETSIPFQEKRKSFEKGAKEEKSKEKSDATKKEELRRDSALFEGVSQGLIHLDAAFTAAPQVQDLLSPKVSKTPPPSPAEFKDITGTVAWTEESSVDSPSKFNQSQDWAEKGKPDSTIETSQQGVATDEIKEEVTIQSVDEPGHISVTSKKTPQKIVETIDIKITENKTITDLEKEDKYRFTMSVADKNSYNDTHKSITEFLDTEKSYSDQLHKVSTEKSSSPEVDVTSSDETDGSQSKSESDAKTDKSFMGKVSKKIFGVFKKDEKAKSGKKSSQNKKHKKEKSDQNDTPIDDTKHIDQSEKLNISHKIDKTVLNESENNGGFVSDNISESEKFKSDDKIKIHEENKGIISQKSTDKEKELKTILKCSKEDIKTELKAIDVSDSNILSAKENGKELAQSTVNDALEYTEMPQSEFNNLNNLLDQSVKVSSKTHVELSVKEAVDSAERSTKEYLHDSISNSKETAAENTAINANKDLSKDINKGIILDVKALADNVEDKYLQVERNVIDVTKPTVTAADKALEDVADASKKSIDVAETTMDKSTTFLGGIFGKSKEHEIPRNANVSMASADDHTNKGVEKTTDGSPEGKKNIFDNSTTDINELKSSSDDKAQSSEKPKKSKGKSKSLFGTIFGKGSNDDKQTAGDTTVFIPDSTEVFQRDEIDIKVSSDQGKADSTNIHSAIIKEDSQHEKDKDIAELTKPDNPIFGPDHSKAIGEVSLALTNDIQDTKDEIEGLSESILNKSDKVISNTMCEPKGDTLESEVAQHKSVSLTDFTFSKTTNAIGDVLRKTLDSSSTTPTNSLVHEENKTFIKITQSGDKEKGDLQTDKAVKSDIDQIIDNSKTTLNETMTIVADKYNEILQTDELVGYDVVKDKTSGSITNLSEQMGITKLKDSLDNTLLSVDELSKETEQISDATNKTELNLNSGKSETVGTSITNPVDPINIGTSHIKDTVCNISEIPKSIKDKSVTFSDNAIKQSEKVIDSTSKIIYGAQKPLEEAASKIDQNTSSPSKSTKKTSENMKTHGKTSKPKGSNEPVEAPLNKIAPALETITNIAKSIVGSGKTTGSNVDSSLGNSTDTAKDNDDDVLANKKSSSLDSGDGIGKRIDAPKETVIQSHDNITKNEQKDLSNSNILTNMKHDALDSGINSAFKSSITEIQGLLDNSIQGSYENDQVLKSEQNDKNVLEVTKKDSSLNMINKNNSTEQDSIPASLMKESKPTLPQKSQPSSEKEHSQNEADDVSHDKKSKDSLNILTNFKDDTLGSGTKSTIKSSITEVQELLDSSIQGRYEQDQVPKSEHVHEFTEKGSSLNTLNINTLIEQGNIQASHMKETEQKSLPQQSSENDYSKNDANNVSHSKKPEEHIKQVKPPDEVTTSSSTNDDKLNNILIDMLIEQECMKNPISDISTQDIDQLMRQSSPILPEKHDTEDSEKLLTNVNSPFKTVASFGQVESLINEEELKRTSITDSVGHSSYVTTPTMQRRRIGGSQRLSREERPDLREVSHMEAYYSSDEDETNYIVTEPSERSSQRTVTFQVESEDEAYLKETDSSCEDVDLEVTEMTPSPDPTSRKQAQVTDEEFSKPQDFLTKEKFSSDKNSQKVERRFERMASETLEADPDMKFAADREFHRMISQLSNEEVDACLTQWDEGGLTPSEELDSTKDTVEGDLDPELEALPEVFLDTSNPFNSTSLQWGDFETNFTNTPESVFWAFDRTPTTVVIQPSELDIPVQSVQVKGESSGEEGKKTMNTSSNREGEEASLDLATDIQDNKRSEAASGPSSAK